MLLWLLLALLLAGALLWSLDRPAPPPDPAPTPTPDPYRNDKAQVDVTELSQGVVRVRYTGGEDRPIKVQLTGEGGKDYNFDLNGEGRFETFPLTQGEGTYTLKVLEHKEDKIYTPVYTLELEVELESGFAPFLRPSQFVNYRDGLSALAAQVTAAGETDGEKAALALDYVTDLLTYDQDKADLVEPGYLPDLDTVLAEGKGICFDYAALLCAMLRSQSIPCKLLVGHSGALYHAWVEVWCEAAGEAQGGVTLEAGGWTRLDPTFLSTDGRSEFILDYMAEAENYQAVYVY